MQTKLLIIFLLSFAAAALSENFKTVNGKEYKDATVTRVDPDGVESFLDPTLRQLLPDPETVTAMAAAALPSMRRGGCIVFVTETVEILQRPSSDSAQLPKMRGR